MFRILMLLLPGLIPSWKFFKTVEPSPRVQWRALSDPTDTEINWQEFRPRPVRISIATILKRLFWNPRWNETLYLVSLAERLTVNPTTHSVLEILRRIKKDSNAEQPAGHQSNYLQFRLVFVHRERGDILEEITYVSEPYRFGDISS